MITIQDLYDIVGKKISNEKIKTIIGNINVLYVNGWNINKNSK